MTGLGRSGATITYDSPTVVRKTGGSTRLKMQFNLMQYLGADVCPAVYHLQTDENDKGLWYTMEALQPFDPYLYNYQDTVEKLMNILRTKIWPKPPLHFYPEWKTEVSRHMKEKAPWMDPELVSQVFQTDPEFVQIHGDCTFANIMCRGRQFVLIDPVPCRAPVPSVREMDGARILQSLAGWERSLLPSWPEYNRDEAFKFFNYEWRDLYSAQSLAQCYWWAAYNCSRILVHDQDPVSSAWAIFWGPTFEKQARHHAASLRSGRHTDKHPNREFTSVPSYWR